VPEWSGRSQYRDPGRVALLWSDWTLGRGRFGIVLVGGPRGSQPAAGALTDEWAPKRHDVLIHGRTPEVGFHNGPL
jgi:hypothetical protein